MGQNTKNGTSQGPGWLNVKRIEMIAHIEPEPLEQGFSSVLTLHFNRGKLQAMQGSDVVRNNKYSCDFGQRVKLTLRILM